METHGLVSARSVMERFQNRHMGIINHKTFKTGSRADVWEEIFKKNQSLKNKIGPNTPPGQVGRMASEIFHLFSNSAHIRYELKKVKLRARDLNNTDWIAFIKAICELEHVDFELD